MKWNVLLARNARRAVVLGLLVAAVAVLMSIPSEGSAAPFRGAKRVTILPPGERYYGKTYNELAGEWWSWALQFPGAQSPLLDTTGEFGRLDQQGVIWFLAGNFGGETVRHLTVPPGRALLIPLLNWLYWTPEDSPLVEECRAMANAGVNAGTDVWCTINGTPVGDIYAYRAQSPAGGFPFAIVEDSLLTEWGYEPRGPEPAVADGYWLLLDALCPGSHTIEWHSRIPDANGPGDDFELHVTYYLTVGQP